MCQKRVLGPLGLKLMIRSHHVGAGNPGPLEKQQVFFTTEPSLSGNPSCPYFNRLFHRSRQGQASVLTTALAVLDVFTSCQLL